MFAQQHQQVVAHHGGRQHHGQHEDGVQQFAPDKAFAGEQVAGKRAKHEINGGGDKGDFEREIKRGEDFGHGEMGGLQ